MAPDLSHATCALCRRGHDPESPCSVVAAQGEGRLGEILGERYQLVRLLGAGGMGIVYEARHTLIGRRLAIKLLHPQCAQQPSMLARFQREARAAGSLENEHITAVTDFGFAADGAPYLVMERLEGEDLAALLARAGALPVARAVTFVIQACRGLAPAHAGGIVHRDLKPANLFLTRRSDGADLVKVLDFGIAKLRDVDETGASITGTGKLLGTACYMPPEQAKGESDLDHRSDIYALGAILYELLTATKAHPGTNYNAVLFHILTQKCVSVRALRPGLPPGLDAVIERAMAFERANRYASVTELGDALAPFAVATVAGGNQSAPILPVAGAGAETIVAAATMEEPATAIAPRPPVQPTARRRGAGWLVAGVVAAIAAAAIVLTRDRPPPAAPSAETPRLSAPMPATPQPPPSPSKEPQAKEPPAKAQPVPPPKRGRPARHAKPARTGPSRTTEQDDDGFDTRNPYE